MTARVAVAVEEFDRVDVTSPGAGQVYNLGPASRIAPGEGRSFWVLGKEVSVFRDRRRQLFATQAWCPHHFGSLADGSVGYAEVTCPLHARRFDLRTGAGRGHDCGALKIYPVRVSRDGDLLITV
jgi:nitrite reductase (NADH) small subunit